MNHKRVVKLDTIHGLNTVLLAKVEELPSPDEYLGADNISISEANKIYKIKCEQFRMKAKLYYEERTCLKGSKIHRNILGYETSEQLDECVLEERKQHTEKYRLTFSPSFFSKDPDAIFENSIKETKRIRLIRNVSEEYNLTFSENVDRKKQSWFTRYCALSKFIQTARSVILKTRLEKNLSMLRNNVLNRACDMQFQEDRICQEFKPAKSGSVGSQIGLKSLE